MLTFDGARHEYRWNGTLVPNVTRVLAPLTDYSRIPPEQLERARQEGIAMHSMVQMDIEGRLDLATLPEWLEPRYAAWLEFCNAFRFRPAHAERRLYHPTLRYAGTADVFGDLAGEWACLDLKRSLYGGRVVGLQIAAYAELWRAQPEGPPPVKRRIALVLRDNGTYEHRFFEDRNDHAVFLAALTMYKWLTPKEGA